MPSTNFKPTTWGQNPYVELTVPSGQLCLVRRPNVRALIALGLVDTVDPLTSLVDEKHIKRVGRGKNAKAELNEQTLMEDPKAIMSLLDIADKVCEYMVMEPAVVRPVRVVDGKEFQLKGHERNPDLVYTDMIDDTDKIFIFSHSIGGTTDLEQFRDATGKSNVGLVNVAEDGRSSV